MVWIWIWIRISKVVGDLRVDVMIDGDWRKDCLNLAGNKDLS